MKAIVIIFLALSLCHSLYADSIELWHRWNADERVQLIKNISKFEVVTGHKVIVNYYDYRTLTAKFINQVKAGKGPDLILTSSSRAFYFLEEDLLFSIDQYVSNEKKSRFISSTLGDAQDSEGFFGLPVTFKLLALIYNRELIKSPPQTTDRLIEIGKKFTDVNQGKYGLAYPVDSFYYHAAWIAGFGGKLLDGNKVFFNSKPHIQAAYFARSLHLGDDAIMPEGVNYDLMLSLFLNRKVPMIINGTWIIGKLLNEKMDIGVAKFPKNSKTGLYPKPFVASELIMMSKNSKNKSSAYQLMDYLTSESAQLLNSRAGHPPTLQSVYELNEFKSSPTYNILSGFKAQAEHAIVRPRRKAMSLVVTKVANSMLKEVLFQSGPIEDRAERFQKQAIQMLPKVQ